MKFFKICLLILFPLAANAQLDTVNGYWNNWNVSTQYNTWNTGTGNSVTLWGPHYARYMPDDTSFTWPETFELPPRFLSTAAYADSAGDLWVIDQDNQWTEYEDINCYSVFEHYDNWGNQYAPRTLNWRVAVTENNGNYYLLDITDTEYDTITSGGEELLTLKRSYNTISYSNVSSEPPYIVYSNWNYNSGFAYLDTVIIHSGNVLDMTYSGGDIQGLLHQSGNNYILGVYCAPCYTWEDILTFEADSLLTGLEVQDVIVPVSGLLPSITWGARDLDGHTVIHYYNGDILSDFQIIDYELTNLRTYGTSRVEYSGGEPDSYYSQEIVWTEYDSQNDITIPHSLTFTPDMVFVPYNRTQASSFNIVRFYPNPFNARILFDLQMLNTDQMNISVFDMLGRQVANLYTGQISSGFHQFKWQADNFSSGTYFIKLETPGNSLSKKVILLK